MGRGPSEQLGAAWRGVPVARICQLAAHRATLLQHRPGCPPQEAHLESPVQQALPRVCAALHQHAPAAARREADPAVSRRALPRCRGPASRKLAAPVGCARHVIRGLHRTTCTLCCDRMPFKPGRCRAAAPTTACLRPHRATPGGAPRSAPQRTAGGTRGGGSGPLRGQTRAHPRALQADGRGGCCWLMALAVLSASRGRREGGGGAPRHHQRCPAGKHRAARGPECGGKASEAA